RLAEAEWVADGDDEIADLQLVRVPELDRLQIPRFDAQDRNVGVRIRADKFRRQLPIILESDDDIVGAVDEVIVGENVASPGINDHTRAPAPLQRILGDVVEAPVQRIVEQRIHRLAALCGDVDDRGRYLSQEGRKARNPTVRPDDRRRRERWKSAHNERHGEKGGRPDAMDRARDPFRHRQTKHMNRTLPVAFSGERPGGGRDRLSETHQPALIAIFFTFDSTLGSFGTFTVNTPFVNSALTLSASTPSGRTIDRWNEP